MAAPTLTHSVDLSGGDCLFTGDDFGILYGNPGVTYSGLLTKTDKPTLLLPPDAMTRQRRRAEARAAAKARR